MSLEEMDEKIRLFSQSAEIKRREAEAALTVFLGAIGSCLKEWFPSYVLNVVTQSPDITISLGSRLSELKREVQPTANSMPDRVVAWIGGDHIWSHRSGFKLDPNSQHVDYSFKGETLTVWIRHPLENALADFAKHFVTRYGYPQQRPNVDYREARSALEAYKTSVEAFSKAQAVAASAIQGRRKFEAAALWNKA